jgi:hypothetical protein
MEFVTEFDEVNKIVITEGTGEVNSEYVRTAAAEAMKIAGEHDCHNFLFDIRPAYVVRSLVAGFQDMSNLGETTGLSLRDRVAVLFSPSSYPEDRARFIENVVTNRSNPVYKMFTDKQSAIDWLKSTE